ncbi:MAG: hypothetical protein OH338_00070 [Candidatus Parvarchaeota archaeon]|nr:hypothetical protein [Candidatus Parvarchaeum tengchongense]MCW1295753.1 hypothetical protein [Candidatus Parvarchaeum tengchongense]MCW1299580.1 hypothetical protein [Candidatus Parvarchaeum tengchongense]MCW1311814.1 hypothetical protein [Candidatus Parvarchaeum tengchongense]
MSLADKYKEELKSQGINVEINSVKIKKDRTKLILAIIGIALAIPLYFLIFTNYNSCSIYAAALSSASGGVSSISGSFYFKCGLDAIMYSVSAAILIFLVLLIILKIVRRRKNR